MPSVTSLKTNSDSDHMNISRVTFYVVRGRFHIRIAVSLLLTYTLLSGLQNSWQLLHFLRERIWLDLLVFLLPSAMSLAALTCCHLLQILASLSAGSPLCIRTFRNVETSSCDEPGQRINSALPLLGWASFHRTKPECVVIVCCEPGTSHQVT